MGASRRRVVPASDRDVHRAQSTNTRPGTPSSITVP